MPTYDYECKACDHHFSAFQSMKDEPLKTCPKCKKDKLKRLLGAGAGFIFKGSGFYCTDYRSPSYDSAAKADSTSSSSISPTTPAVETKSESKPEAKAESKKDSKKAKKSKPAA